MRPYISGLDNQDAKLWVYDRAPRATVRLRGHDDFCIAYRCYFNFSAVAGGSFSMLETSSELRFISKTILSPALTLLASSLRANGTRISMAGMKSGMSSCLTMSVMRPSGDRFLDAADLAAHAIAFGVGFHIARVH